MARLCIDRFFKDETPENIATVILNKNNDGLSHDQLCAFAQHLAANSDSSNAFAKLVSLYRDAEKAKPRVEVRSKDNDEEFIRQAEHASKQRKRATTGGSLISKRSSLASHANDQLFDLREPKRLMGIDPYWQNNPRFVYIGRHVQHHTGIGELQETRWSIPADLYTDMSSLERIQKLYVGYLHEHGITPEHVKNELSAKLLVCNCGHVYDSNSPCHGHTLLKMLE